jgi:hypothetical protein
MKGVKHWEPCGELECRCVERMLADHVHMGGDHPFEHARKGSRHPWSGRRRRAARHYQGRVRINRPRYRDELHARNQ